MFHCRARRRPAARRTSFEDMQLARHGLEKLESPVRLFAPAPDGRALVLHTDPPPSARQIENFSKKDGAKYFELSKKSPAPPQSPANCSILTPPVIEKPSNEDLWKLLKIGRKVRGLGKKEMMQLVRWGPMAVADFVAEFFETDLLRAAVAARGIFGASLGPWSAGSTALLLLRAAADPHPVGNSAYPRGGMGALTAAMAAAAKEAGAEIRTGADVAQILVKARHCHRRRAFEWRRNRCESRRFRRRPAPHVAQFARSRPLAAQLRRKNAQFPQQLASPQKSIVALDGLPSFTALAHSCDGNAALAGRIHIGPGIDYLEHAFDDSKYGEFSPRALSRYFHSLDSR